MPVALWFFRNGVTRSAFRFLREDFSSSEIALRPSGDGFLPLEFARRPLGESLWICDVVSWLVWLFRESTSRFFWEAFFFTALGDFFNGRSLPLCSPVIVLLLHLRKTHVDFLTRLDEYSLTQTHGIFYFFLLSAPMLIFKSTSRSNNKNFVFGSFWDLPLSASVGASSRSHKLGHYDSSEVCPTAARLRRPTTMLTHHLQIYSGKRDKVLRFTRRRERDSLFRCNKNKRLFRYRRSSGEPL